MRALFWLLALFAMAVGVALLANYNEGYVLLVLAPWRAEVSLNFFIVALIACFVLGYGALRVVVRTLQLPVSVSAWRERKRRENALDALREAAIQLFEGRYGQALKNAAVAYAANESPAVAALMAARAAGGMRDAARTDEWLKRAAEHDREVRTARLMTEAELAVNARRYDDALTALVALRAGGQRHIAALRLALRVYRGVGRWDEVLRIVRQLENHRALTPEAAAPLKLRAHLENLRSKSGDARALAACWQAVPRDERRMSRAAVACAQALIAANDAATAQRIIETQLDIEWSSELAEIYGACTGGDALSRIGRAEGWLKKQPRDARLLLALGRLCREQQLWGKAQSYYEASLAVEPTQQAWAEFAALLDQLGKTEEANRAYRSAAQLCGKT